MKTKLNIENWNRKEHFEFFIKFEEPFFGLTFELDCAKAYYHCKEKNYSFFLYYLHQSLKAANNSEHFRYRILENEVYLFDKINASATVNRTDNTFGFSYMYYHKEYADFEKGAKIEIERIQNSNKLMPLISGPDVIHYSSLPWIKFTSLSHARSFSSGDSCPKISFGKLSDNKVMPVSIHVHHALVDGFHVGQYINEFQQLMNPDN